MRASVMTYIRHHIRTQRKAWIATEVIVAVSLAALMAVLTVNAVSDYAKTLATDRSVRAATWAADAQLQRYQAGAALDSPPPPGLIADDIRLQTTRAEGQGQWAGFDRVTVTAEAASVYRTVRVQVCGYVPQEVKP